MMLFKLVQQFIVPSVFVGVFILIGLIVWKQKLGKILLITGFILYYLFSLSPIADLLLYPLENKYSIVTEKNINSADTIVLLLGGKEGNVLRASEILRLHSLADNPLEIIISGSRPLNPEINEAEKVKIFLKDRGIPENNILLEDTSRTTKESAYYVKEMVNNKPFFLVTSAYHMPRSMYIFEKAGTLPIPAPTDFKVEFIYAITDIFPNAENLRKTDIAFHEYIGMLYYKIF
ncbi:YdcF family protein [Patescibacteria group bacterium AH-259-L05]|nr:YdcF family protein [Patescibacteria group bacterium AH-259-L05]